MKKITINVYFHFWSIIIYILGPVHIGITLYLFFLGINDVIIFNALIFLLEIIVILIYKKFILPQKLIITDSGILIVKKFYILKILYSKIKRIFIGKDYLGIVYNDNNKLFFFKNLEGDIIQIKQIFDQYQTLKTDKRDHKYSKKEYLR